MKKRVPSFLAGMVAMALVSALGFTALAATNMIEVNPISILVNGKIFEPKDANGASVPVFAYNGTTYAPLRALGETFGQKIYFDEKTGMAGVGEKVVEPDATIKKIETYEDFRALWRLELDREIVGISHYVAQYNGILSQEQVQQMWDSVDTETMDKYKLDFAIETYWDNNIKQKGNTLILIFKMGEHQFGRSQYYDKTPVKQ